MNRAWYRKSIDKEKSTGYTETALGNLWNKLEKKNRFMKQKNPTIYVLREKAGNNSSLRDKGRLLRYGSSPWDKAKKEQVKQAASKKTPEGVFFQGFS